MRLRSIPCVAVIAALAPLAMLSACSRSQGGSTPAPVVGGLPAVDTVAAVPLGQLAGEPALSVTAMSTGNPYEKNPQAIQQGKQLYIRMNCAGCHAYTGKGNMGPDLTDSEWRYGGLPVQVYKSIRDGRPQGMPAWGVTLPPDDIWKVVAYIQSLGGTTAVGDYEHARQGDKPGEQVAPEAQADAELAPASPVETSQPMPVEPTATKTAAPVAPKGREQTLPPPANNEKHP